MGEQLSQKLHLADPQMSRVLGVVRNVGAVERSHAQDQPLLEIPTYPSAATTAIYPTSATAGSTNTTASIREFESRQTESSRSSGEKNSTNSVTTS
jgi:hypothetical protein